MLMILYLLKLNKLNSVIISVSYSYCMLFILVYVYTI